MVYTSATGNIGIQPLLNTILNLLPDAISAGSVTGKDSHGNEVQRKIADSELFSAFVFKTFSDPFTGRISLFRVYSGTLTTELQPYNPNKGVTERIGSIMLLQGKTQVTVPRVHAGDIAAVAKLKETQTGDTLADKAHPIIYPAVKWIEPVISFAIEPKSNADIEKISLGLHKLIEEDPTLEFSRHADTKEMVLSGMGQLHIDLALEKLRRKYGAEVVLHMPKIPYRETIRITAQAQGKYKKQTGGHGQ